MDNAQEALYIGLYTFIFVIALSLTVGLFSSIMNYTDDAYEFMHTSSNGALIISERENRHIILSSTEVLSYYFNYIKKDRLDSSVIENNAVVTINLNTKDETPIYLDSKNLSYKEALQKIGQDNKYILTVGKQTNDNVTYINIVKATPEELEEEW
jgi:hypothetical protein